MIECKFMLGYWYVVWEAEEGVRNHNRYLDPRDAVVHVQMLLQGKGRP